MPGPTDPGEAYGLRIVHFPARPSLEAFGDLTCPPRKWGRVLIVFCSSNAKMLEASRCLLEAPGFQTLEASGWKAPDLPHFSC